MQFLNITPGLSVQKQSISGYRTKFKADKYIYVIGGVHGDEREGVYLVEKLFLFLKTSEHDLPIIVIPMLNPDGFQSKTRFNSNNVDLNRNYPCSSWESSNPQHGSCPLSEPENQFLNTVFKKFHPRIIFSFHSWKPMINYNGACQEIAAFLSHYNSYDICSELIDHPTPGSLGDFAPEVFQSPVITFEAPLVSKTLTLENIWEENQRGLETLFSSELIQKFLKT